MDKNKIMRSFHEQADMMEDRINLGIESNRKGYMRLNFTDSEGKPINGVSVKIRQKSHHFKFGCNLFKYKCFDSEEENLLYEQKFLGLFNLAVAPFYWNDFEPQKGKPRFEKDSVWIDRRPPSEAVLEFCTENSIEAKGHPLFWPVMSPEWLPENWDGLKHYITKRLKEIAARYDGVIKSFDCINEATTVVLRDHEPYIGEGHYRNFNPLSGNYPEWVFKQTDRFFAESRLVLNETTALSWGSYNKELSNYYLLAEKLIKSGCRVDTIGLQYHNFRSPDNMEELADWAYNPTRLFKVMDCYASLQRPLSVSEITVPGYDDDMQAEVLYNLYRIWFSHPNMESIIYWNLGDNCAIKKNETWTEQKYMSGLVKNDFSEKPSYRVLDRLINKEWQTNMEYDCRENFSYVKCFYGKYEIEVCKGNTKVKREIDFTPKGYDEFYIVL